MFGGGLRQQGIQRKKNLFFQVQDAFKPNIIHLPQEKKKKKKKGKEGEREGRNGNFLVQKIVLVSVMLPNKNSLKRQVTVI